jgi:hypothetical protein
MQNKKDRLGTNGLFGLFAWCPPSLRIPKVEPSLQNHGCVIGHHRTNRSEMTAALASVSVIVHHSADARTADIYLR